jgi:ATPase subunit of ABC transporter with duplicated ATPase domains
MISLSQVGKRFGPTSLFEGVTLQLKPGERYGLVGSNGSGKSTLLAMLIGDEPASDGDITIPSKARVGVLQQDRYRSEAQRIIDVAMMGDTTVWAALERKQALLEEVEQTGADLATALADVEDEIQHEDGYSLTSRAGAILEGLGIASELHEEPLSRLSGGFKLRVLLAQTLVGRPDILLLDEPTNHLDILTIAWLEDFLRRYQGLLVVVSHDRNFIDNVASQVLDVDYGTITLYPGNYTAFEINKQLTRERKNIEIERQRKIVAEKKAFVERFRAKNTKARQAQSRLKQIDKIHIEELANTSRRAPSIRFEQTRRSGRDVLSLEAIDKAYGDNVVLSGIDLTLRRAERLAVIGGNGIGKSTLLKIMVGRIEADDGKHEWGHEAHVGFFPQDHHECLGQTTRDANTTVLDYLWNFCPQETTSFVRGWLGRVLFSGEDVEKRLGALSGGEAARLIFAQLAIQQPNVLVLDEPTNHLDIEAIGALVEALKAYPGTLVFVSHDRWFVSELATRVLELRSDGYIDYPGSYAEYLARDGHDHLDATTALRTSREERAQQAGDAKSASQDDWEEQKRRRKREKQLVTRRDKLTAAIDQAETRSAEIQARYCEPGFFASTPDDTVSSLQAEEVELAAKIENLIQEWEAVETELAAD